jgi:hypothetical protein
MPPIHHRGVALRYNSRRLEITCELPTPFSGHGGRGWTLLGWRLVARIEGRV